MPIFSRENIVLATLVAMTGGGFLLVIGAVLLVVSVCVSHRLYMFLCYYTIIIGCSNEKGETKISRQLEETNKLKPMGNTLSPNTYNNRHTMCSFISVWH